MDETTEKVSSNKEDAKIPESPKPLAFTIDFGEKPVDTQRFKSLVEKYQNRHRLGQSLSKLEEPSISTVRKHPLTGNLPRKSSFHSEGYFSSDEKIEKFKNQGARSTVLNTVIAKGDLTLPSGNVTSDRMTQSFPSHYFDLPSMNSPEIELKDVSSPELDLISPISPLNIENGVQSNKIQMNSANLVNLVSHMQNMTKQHFSHECETAIKSDTATMAAETFVCGTEFDFENNENIEKADTVSDAGTYTLDADNYTEEQKERMSIDRDFNIEQVSGIKKTEEYVKSLTISNHQTNQIQSEVTMKQIDTAQKYQREVAQQTIKLSQNTVQTGTLQHAQKPPNAEGEPTKITKKIFNKIMYPSMKYQSSQEMESNGDQGIFTSITASGVLSKKPEKQGHVRRSSLVQSEIFVEAYTGDVKSPKQNGVEDTKDASNTPKRNSLILDDIVKIGGDVDLNVVNYGVSLARITNLSPPIVGISGKSSPTKIPSPVHALRPRSSNSQISQNFDLSDSSLETESYLKPTQNIISSLQARLSIDSDQDSDYDKTYTLNNDTKNLLKNQTLHVRHNSFDDRNVKISNKLEHFHSKNLQGIDQTLKTCNQYSSSSKNKHIHRIQNSPNNSPIRRSSSFSLKNKFDNQPKCLNTKESNITTGNSIQRSASTANIKPSIEQLRRASVSSEHQKGNKAQYLDTESSSEDEYDKVVTKNKKDLTTTRYNRAFSLRRARLDNEPPVPKCPNTPEMRRKFMSNDKSERTVSVDRNSARAPEVPSRYLNINKTAKYQQPKVEVAKPLQKPLAKPTPSKPPVFSRTDTGQFSMRTPKPTSVAPKPVRKDQQGNKKQSGPRSNSSLSSREVDFQNWKRRKSYDPMKAAAEGKRKAELARKQNQNVMTQSYNEAGQEYDSSPSHSSSVHRSQSFHGTAALEQLISSDDEDLTLSGDEAFSPPTPSPCELSPDKSNLRQIWRDRFSKSKR